MENDTEANDVELTNDEQTRRSSHCSTPARLTPTQKQSLEAVAMVLAGIDASLSDAGRDELLIMLDACKAVSETNCWCWTYAAAKYVEPEVRRLLNETE